MLNYRGGRARGGGGRREGIATIGFSIFFDFLRLVEIFDQNCILLEIFLSREEAQSNNNDRPYLFRYFSALK